MFKAVLFALICVSLFAEPGATDRYLGYTGELLEQKHLGDEHLLFMIAGAEQGQAVSPISENEAQVSIVHQVAKQTFAKILKEPIELDRIIPWAKARLSQQLREREEKKKMQEETKIPWKIQHGPSQVSLSLWHTCAVDVNKHALCWGTRAFGVNRAPVELGPIQGLASHDDFNCGLREDGRVMCWGSSHSWPWTENGSIVSELGLSKSLSASALGVCSVGLDDLVRCYGPRNMPAVPSDLGPVQVISVGNAQVCAVTAVGVPRCWSKFSDGNDVPSDLGIVQSIAVGHGGICAIDMAARVKCWGDFRWGNISQLNLELSKLSGVKSVSVSTDSHFVPNNNHGWGRVCVVKSDDLVECFDYKGQLSPVPSDLGFVRNVIAGRSHICAIELNGILRCWGLNDSGQCDVPDSLVQSLSGSLGDWFMGLFR